MLHHRSLEWCASILPIMGFQGLSVLELGRDTRQTEGQMDRHRQSFHNTHPMQALMIDRA